MNKSKINVLLLTSLLLVGCNNSNKESISSSKEDSSTTIESSSSQSSSSSISETSSTSSSIIESSTSDSSSIPTIEDKYAPYTKTLTKKKNEEFKILCFTDIQLHDGEKTDITLNIIDTLVNKNNPDLIVFLGDLLNDSTSYKSLNNYKTVIDKFNSYNIPFAPVLGNHDWHVGGEEITRVLEDNGIKVLANNNTSIFINGQKIYIAGVEDLQTRTPKINEALNNTSYPTILLTHSPDVFPFVPTETALTLAGHVHGGQVRLPFLGATIIPSKYGNRYSQGLIEEKGKRMIVTRGIGNSILNIRFNCVPEIVVIEFN